MHRITEQFWKFDLIIARHCIYCHGVEKLTEDGRYNLFSQVWHTDVCVTGFTHEWHAPLLVNSIFWVFQVFQVFQVMKTYYAFVFRILIRRLWRSNTYGVSRGQNLKTFKVQYYYNPNIKEVFMHVVITCNT